MKITPNCRLVQGDSSPLSIIKWRSQRRRDSDRVALFEMLQGCSNSLKFRRVHQNCQRRRKWLCDAWLRWTDGRTDGSWLLWPDLCWPLGSLTHPNALRPRSTGKIGIKGSRTSCRRSLEYTIVRSVDTGVGLTASIPSSSSALFNSFFISSLPLTLEKYR